MVKKALRIVLIYTFLLLTMIPTTKIFAQSPTYPASKKWLFNGHEYQLIFESVSWSEAKEYCESVGGHLVTLNTSDEYEFIKNKVVNGDNWIGAYADGNVIKWVDGSLVDENVVKFLFGEPSYVANYFTLDADDNYFDQSYPGRGFICEWDDSKIVTDLTGEELEDPLYKQQQIKVILNGTELSFDQPPIIENDRVMVPIRAIFEALGYTVDWYGDTQTAVAHKGDNTITVQINNPEISYNRGTYVCDVPPQIVSGRTLVPVRAISECAGCNVGWNGETKTVIITSNEA